MSDTLLLFISILISSGLGLFLGLKYGLLQSKSKQIALEEREYQLKKVIEELKADNRFVREEKEKLRNEKEELNTELVRKSSDIQNLIKNQQIREQELVKQQELLENKFKVLADRILKSNSEQFALENKNSIKTILEPLQEKIKDFEKRVEDNQKERITLHSSLKEQLLGLKELNLQMTKEATNLTKALKGDSKIQGNWGELVLERVLEKSGLEKDREYFVQQSFQRQDGSRVMPDVVLYLPDSKKMIIDSKVSLTDYERYINSSEEEQSIYLTAHVNSIKKHIDQLSEKNYQDLYDIESPDFVLMFIPIEPAFAVAINKDNSLYNKAFEKNIVIVTPSTLLATLRTIDTMWNNEKQQQNAIEIAKQAGGLYDKFEGLVQDLTGVGKKIDAAKSDYSQAMNKLVEGRGNLISRVEKLKKMGAKAKKSLPENILKRSEETSE
jgi:DNA recombination protein RmuC